MFESESVVLMLDNGYCIEVYIYGKNITYEISIEFVEMEIPTTDDPSNSTHTDFKDTETVNTDTITFSIIFIEIFSVSHLIRNYNRY